MQHVCQIAMTRLQIHGKSVVTRPVSWNRLHTLELQEKVEALLKKNPSAGSEEHQVHHKMRCHATTSMPQPYRPSDIAWRQYIGGKSIRGVKWCEAGRTSLEMTDSLPLPGDHDDLGGVEKGEGRQ